MLLRLHLVQDRLQPLAGVVREPAGDPRDVLVGCEDEEPARERDLRREAGALATHRVLRDLHHDRLPGLQHPLDAWRPAAFEVLRCVVDLARVQDAVASPADVDERCLHPGEHVLDATQVDVAHHRMGPAARDVVLHEGVLLEHGDLVPFTVLGDDHQLVGDPRRRDLRLALTAATPASDRARTQPARGSTGRHLLLERLRASRDRSGRSGRSFRSCRSCRAGASVLPSPASDRFRPRPPRRRLFLGVPDPSGASSADAAADSAAARSSGCASSRWLPGVCSGSFTAAPLRLRPPRVPWRPRPSSAPSSVRPSAGSATSVPVSSPRGPGGTAPATASAASAASAAPTRSLRGVGPARLRGRTVVVRLRRSRPSPCGRLLGVHRRCPAPRGPAGRSVRRVARPRAACLPPSARPGRARALWWPARPTGTSGAGRSGGVRPRASLGAAPPRSLDPWLLPSLGARGRSGSRHGRLWTRGLRDERSIAGAAAFAARRAEDLLVQLSVLSGAAPPARRSPCSDSGPPAASRATSLASSPITSGASRLPALMGHVCASRIAVPVRSRWERSCREGLS